MFNLFGRKKPAAPEAQPAAPTSSAVDAASSNALPDGENGGEGGLSRLKSALSVTGQGLVGRIFGVMADAPAGDPTPFTEDRIDEIEEILIRADVGLDTATMIADRLRAEKQRLKTAEDLMRWLRAEFSAILTPYEAANQLGFKPEALNVYLVVGVNGAGKTTFIGKLAHRFMQQGHRVVIGAGDTFRAAAVGQLRVWAERAGAEFIGPAFAPDGSQAVEAGESPSSVPASATASVGAQSAATPPADGADRAPAATMKAAYGEGDSTGGKDIDPAAVMYDAIIRARETGANVVLLDTAGRLQNKYNLMEELKKIRRVIDKAMPAGTHLEALLVLDATTGQNALKQAEVFKEAVDISGVVLTKLDGSAKGGVVLTIAREHQLPVKLIGVGEGIDDLRDFHADDFIEALFAR